MTTDLDNYGIPRKYPGTDGLAQLQPGDSEGVGALYSAPVSDRRTDNRANDNRRIAHAIGELWGVQYLAAGEGVKATMRQAARQVIIECEGNLEAVEGLIEMMKADPKWAGPCKKCQSPYSVAGRIKAYRAKQLSASAPVDYLEGRTPEEWEEERAENARIRAEWLARKAATK